MRTDNAGLRNCLLQFNAEMFHIKGSTHTANVLNVFSTAKDIYCLPHFDQEGSIKKIVTGSPMHPLCRRHLRFSRLWRFKSPSSGL